MLGFVINWEEGLNPHLATGICERFITTLSLDADNSPNCPSGPCGRCSEGFSRLLDGVDTTQVVQAPTLLYKHPWPNSREYMDSPEGEVVFVCFRSSTEMSCLMEDFFM